MSDFGLLVLGVVIILAACGEITTTEEREQRTREPKKYHPYKVVELDSGLKCVRVRMDSNKIGLSCDFETFKKNGGVL